MMATQVLRGGEFIIKDEHYSAVYTPEEKTEEEQMMFDMTHDFVDAEVFTRIQDIEHQRDGITPRLLEKAGALGLLGGHIPEEFGGTNLDTNANTFICEAMGKCGSFTVSFAAHTGIGMLPILYYGTEAQKQKYLPRLVSGELKACYCLTEPGSGSDALAAKTRADLTADGKYYLLNGQKMWISNGGFADIFIVFAKIGGEKFTGFIVEGGTPGLSLGAEEHKMGIKGSSTRQVFFENVQVPVENLLGEIGKGHRIAFNVLNVGRFKLGALVLGGAKQTLLVATKYANERQQFQQPISQFGAIQYKLAEMAIRSFALESAQYRVSDMIQKRINELKSNGSERETSKLGAAEEYATECAILKVFGSEVIDYCADECVQVHGGYGFSLEYEASRYYCDSRINRIFEGTNEINRMLAVDMIFRRAMGGQLDIVGPAWAVQKELLTPPSFAKPEGYLAEERKAVRDFKKALLMVAGAAAKYQMDGKIDLKSEQEILMNIADMLIGVFTTESVLLRVEKVVANNPSANKPLLEAVLKTFLYDQSSLIQKWATDALHSFAEGDELRMMVMGANRFCKYAAQPVKAHRRLIAQHVIEAGGWCF